MKKVEKMMRDIDIDFDMSHRLIGKDSLDQRILDAMKSVPRHKFVPANVMPFSYDNHALSIGQGQTISQPFIVALMTDLLKPNTEDIILEIGTGSGYQAAVLSLLVKQVYSIEIVKCLAIQASKRLQKLNYMNIEVRLGDGALGWPNTTLYNGIIVTAAVPYIPQPLVDQLKPGGNMVIPIGLPNLRQELMVVEKHKNGNTQVRDILSVSFVPLTRNSGE